MKYDAKTMKIVGKATKPGVYTVKVTATNASATGKKAVVETFNITVPNLKWDEEIVGVALEDRYLLQAGIAPALSNEVAAIAGAGWKLAVSGLPSGVKFDAKKGAISVIAAKGAKYTTVKASGSATLVPIDDEHGAVFIYLAPKGLSPHARSLDVLWSEE